MILSTLFNHALADGDHPSQTASLRQSLTVSYQNTRTIAAQSATKYGVKPDAYKAPNEKNATRMLKSSAKKNSCGTIVGPILE